MQVFVYELLIIILCRKQGVIRKVLQHKDKKVANVANALQLLNHVHIQEDDEIDPVCVGESGASPPAERKATRRSHRKKTAQEAVVSYVEPSSPDEDDADVSWFLSSYVNF